MEPVALPIHYATGRPMARCPSCGCLSGLSGIDGGDCLACTGGFEREDEKADQSTNPEEALHGTRS